MGGSDPTGQIVDDPALDVRPGEAPGNVDRAHERERLLESEDALHEDGVLVGWYAVLDDVPLPDGLDEAGVEAPPPEAVEDPEGHGRLAPVLASGGEVDLAHRGSEGRLGFAPRRARPAVSSDRGPRSCAR